MEEIWKPIPEFEEYEISNLGRIRTEKPLMMGKNGKTPYFRGVRYLKPSIMNGYQVINLRGKQKKKLHYIHRLLWQLFKGEIPKGIEIDHINGDRINNSFENLRLATVTQNLINCKTRKVSKLGYRGVRRNPDSSTYFAAIKVGGKLIRLGNFRTIKEAALAYNEGARKYHGEFAVLNEV